LVIPWGVQDFTGDRTLVEVIGVTGFDFITLDAEHSGSNPATSRDLVRTSGLAGLAAYVRVPDQRAATDTRRALKQERRAFLPEMHSVADIEAAAPAAFFPPKRDRGICPSARMADYNFAAFLEDN